MVPLKVGDTLIKQMDNNTANVYINKSEYYLISWRKSGGIGNRYVLEREKCYSNWNMSGLLLRIKLIRM